MCLFAWLAGRVRTNQQQGVSADFMQLEKQGAFLHVLHAAWHYVVLSSSSAQHICVEYVVSVHFSPCEIFRLLELASRRNSQSLPAAVPARSDFNIFACISFSEQVHAEQSKTSTQARKLVAYVSQCLSPVCSDNVPHMRSVCRWVEHQLYWSTWVWSATRFSIRSAAIGKGKVFHICSNTRSVQSHLQQ